MAFVEKPIQSKEVLDAMLDKLHAYLARPHKSLLVALKDVAARREFLAQIEDEQIEATVVKSAEKLLEALEESRFDCVVLEDGFPGDRRARMPRACSRRRPSSGRCRC